jgi:hypothetical protein
MTTRTSSGNGARFLNFLAYIAVIAVGGALLISWVFQGNGNLAGALTLIANALAYIITACYSWRFARTKGTVYIVVWVVSVVLIAVFMILPQF